LPKESFESHPPKKEASRVRQRPKPADPEADLHLVALVDPLAEV